MKGLKGEDMFKNIVRVEGKEIYKAGNVTYFEATSVFEGVFLPSDEPLPVYVHLKDLKLPAAKEQ